MCRIEENVPTKLVEADITPRGNVHKSPCDWRNEILYFLLPDRFNGESEGELYDKQSHSTHAAKDIKKWMREGTRFQGGTIKGIMAKLDYLKNLGITTLWIAPLFKQRQESETYHGYAIQNFLDIDPRFGTRHELRELVDAAHKKGMYVLLDIIYNHTGDNWYYKDADGKAVSQMSYINPGGNHPFYGWKDKNGHPITSDPVDLNDGVWPKEFQNKEWYVKAGSIERWDPQAWEKDLGNPNNPWIRGDFFTLKSLDLTREDTLSALIKVYSYWIAISDCDGFRIDTTKHVPLEASRKFCGGIREYAESIGKENFLLLGEVTGGTRSMQTYLEISGINIDAALDLGEPAKAIAEIIKYRRSPSDYAHFYTKDDALGSHRMVGKYHVSILDDHDKVGFNEKARFAKYNDNLQRSSMQIAQAVCMQLTTLGIPCIYYGTEQGFDGNEGMHRDMYESRDDLDRYVRECMFAAKFGAFETESCHFFDSNNPTYKRIASLSVLRTGSDGATTTDSYRVSKALQSGRMYQRQISYDSNGSYFVSHAEGGGLIAWSRIHAKTEILIVMNVDNTSRKGLVTIDNKLSKGKTARWLYSNGSDNDVFDNNITLDDPLIKEVGNGRVCVDIDLPPAGIAILTFV